MQSVCPSFQTHRRTLSGGRNIVAFAIDHVPAEAAPLVGERIDSHDIGDPAVELDLIMVDNRHDVIDVMKRAEHGCFPNLTFLNFAVAQDDVDAEGSYRASRERHAEAERQAFAERSGGRFERGNESHIGWPW